MEIAPEIAEYLQTLSPAERDKIPNAVIHPALASNHIEPDPYVRAVMDGDIEAPETPEDNTVMRDGTNLNQPLKLEDLVVSRRNPDPIADRLEGTTLESALEDSNNPYAQDFVRNTAKASTDTSPVDASESVLVTKDSPSSDVDVNSSSVVTEADSDVGLSGDADVSFDTGDGSGGE